MCTEGQNNQWPIFCYSNFDFLPSHPIPTTHIHYDSYANRTPLIWTCFGIATWSSSCCCISDHNSCCGDSCLCSTLKKERKDPCVCSWVWSCWTTTTTPRTRSHCHWHKCSICLHSTSQCSTCQYQLLVLHEMHPVNLPPSRHVFQVYRYYVSCAVSM